MPRISINTHGSKFTIGPYRSCIGRNAKTAALKVAARALDAASHQRQRKTALVKEQATGTSRATHSAFAEDREKQCDHQMQPRRVMQVITRRRNRKRPEIKARRRPGVSIEAGSNNVMSGLRPDRAIEIHAIDPRTVDLHRKGKSQRNQDRRKSAIQILFES